MRSLCINWHLGLGDHLLCNGLVRHYAAMYDIVVLPVWAHNKASIDFMFRDLGKIEARAIKHTKEIPDLIDGCDECLDLGFAREDFDAKVFDRSFYTQANVDFEKRWSDFKFTRDESIEAKCNVPFRFVHDDWGRGFQITRIKADDSCPIVRPHPLPNIFQFIWMLENADEIHCIDSSFLSLADSIPTKAKRLVYHRYARNSIPPILKKAWDIIE